MATRPEDYNVGWICAVEPERIIACELLDEEYTGDRVPYTDSQRDHNIYTFGRMHQHRIVIAGLPQGRYGISSATRVAEHMQASFPALQAAFMVGIAGGVPSQKRDIRLGDVVVSCPARNHCGVIHYDFGKAVQDQAFEATGHLTSPSNILLNAVAALKARHKRDGHKILSTIAAVLRNRRLRAEYSRPGAGMDRLYKPDYIHSRQEICDCQKLSEIQNEPDLDSDPHLIQRLARGPDEDDPTIHYGLIASADRLIKDARLRDTLSQKYDVLCFEMEAAGLMNSDLRFLVIRGICDYADTHKNDAWQGYAAATAATYAKELLELISPCEFGARTYLAEINNIAAQPRQRTIKAWAQSVDQPTNYISRSIEDSEDTVVDVESVNCQQSLIHSVQDEINTFLTNLRNTFFRGPEASEDIRIDVCIEIAKQSDQLETSIRIKTEYFSIASQDVQNGSLLKQQKTSQDYSPDPQIFPSKEAAIFTLSSTLLIRFYKIGCSLSHPKKPTALLDILLNCSLSTWLNADDGSVSIYIYIMTAEKTGDLSSFPISSAEWVDAYWTPPQSIVRILESVLQDLDLIGVVTKVHLPLLRDHNGIFRYNFETIETHLDYEQKNLLEQTEDEIIKYLRESGCKRYNESQLSTLKRLGTNTFLVTDGSGDYTYYTAPFARTAWDVNEFEYFVQSILRARKLSVCKGAPKLIGIVLDDHSAHLKGMLIESPWTSITKLLHTANTCKFLIPRALRRLWAKQLVSSVSELHSKGLTMSSLAVAISYSLDLVYRADLSYSQYQTRINGQPPEGEVVGDIAPKLSESIQKKDMFQIGFELWRLSEHIPFTRKYLCLRVGCETRPYYSCVDNEHRDPISLPHSQHGDPALKEVIERCRMDNPKDRPLAQELAVIVNSELSLEEDIIEISRQKRALRTAMNSIPSFHGHSSVYCDECLVPVNSYLHCSTCFQGNFDLCDSCFTSGVRCLDSKHQLLKTKIDSLGNITQTVQGSS